MSPVLEILDLRNLDGDVISRLPRPKSASELPVEAVSRIVRRVRDEGDRAVVELTREFDGVELQSTLLGPQVMKSAYESISADLAKALEAASSQVLSFYETRRSVGAVQGTGPLGDFKYGGDFDRSGFKVTTLMVPLERAGLYAPGGRAKYPSSVLMTVLPAKAAGVSETFVAIPPGPDGLPPIESLAAAHICGVDGVIPVGGAQAIAAMAYGTEMVPKVDVIAGPGNVYVSLAMREVSGIVAVPRAFAGPSEVVVVADSGSDPDLVAIDLMVQAEHGPDGLAWLVSEEESVVSGVTESLSRLVPKAVRSKEISSTLARGGYAAICGSVDVCAKVVNYIAPEHLEIMTKAPEVFAGMIRNAGCIFLGSGAPATVGDYFAGPSHVLPTNQTARYASVLSVSDFMKEMNIVEADMAQLPDASAAVIAIAEAEGLFAHADSIRMRSELR